MIVLRGDGTLRASLATARDALTDLTDPGRDLGNVLVADAVTHAPRLTGALAETVTATPGPDGVTLTAGSPRVHYARIVHARTPWLAQTIIRAQNTALTTLAGHIQTDILTKVKGT